MQTDDFEVFEQEIGEAADGGVGDVQVLQDCVGGVRPEGRHQHGVVDGLALYRDGVETLVLASITYTRRL